MNDSIDWLGLNGRQRSASVNTAVGSSSSLNPNFAGANNSTPVVSFGVNYNSSPTPVRNHLSSTGSVQDGRAGNPSTNNGAASPIPPIDRSNLPQFRLDDTSYVFKNTSADEIGTHKDALSSNHRSFFSKYDQPPNDSVDSFVSSDEDDSSSIPLSLTAQELSLQESKTYMRWYSDILARTNSRTITMNDIFNFLNNFRIPVIVKEKIKRMFSKIVSSINIGQFFALLRLISHTLQGQEPRRKLIKCIAPVPCPPSILSKKRQNDDDDDINDNDTSETNTNQDQKNDKPLDLDGFTKFMLTGERPDDPPKKKKSKKSKSVKFMDEIVTDVHDVSFINSPISSPQPQELDYSLPMDQLLSKIKSQQSPKQQEEEKEVLKDMESQINHFQNLNSVDSASIGGVPASLHSMHSSEHLLQPNMTGPAQMAQYMKSNQEQELLKPNMTGPAQMAQLYNVRAENNISPLQSTIHDPADMAKLFAPPPQQNSAPPVISLQSFTSQMTGNTLANTLHNSGTNNDSTYSDSFDRRINSPPVPSRGGTTSNTIQSSFTDNNLNTPNAKGPPVPPRSPLGNVSSNNSKVPPPPPPSRRRQSSAASNHVPPLPPKIEVDPYSSQSNSSYMNNFPPIDNFNTQNQYAEIEPSGNGIYGNKTSNDSTANILDDLKALQEEVDKIRNMTGGF